VGRGRARIDEAARERLGVEFGGFIEITARRATVASASRTAPEDESKGVIRIDGLLRRNVGVDLGDKVRVRKAEVLPAAKIALAPIISVGHKISFGEGIENFVRRSLLNRPLRKGDVLIVPGIALMGGALPFMVTATTPDTNVQVVDQTEISLLETPVREGAALPPDQILAAFADRLSDLMDEFGARLSAIGGETGERAQLFANKISEIIEELRKQGKS